MARLVLAGSCHSRFALHAVWKKIQDFRNIIHYYLVIKVTYSVIKIQLRYTCIKIHLIKEQVGLGHLADLQVRPPVATTLSCPRR